MQLIIGNYNYSTWSMRPWLFVDFHSLPVEIIQMPLFSDQLASCLQPRFSNGKVPLLLDGDVEVWDSIAILEYLGECYPDSGAWPADRTARAVARAACAEMHSSFHALRSELPMNCRRYFPDYRLSAEALADIHRVTAIWAYCKTRFGTGGPWLFGSFSNVDAMFAPVVMRFRSVDVSLSDLAMEYCHTVNACPSVKKWVSLALGEQEVVPVDEIDAPSELLSR
ncbi:MAG: glutathione S-transferase [Acidiferrobacterales bacterium]|nr:glutathione S-transferase [Acidiferrobacterales bacterium]